MIDDDPMTFGTHADEKMKDVPADYLLWLADQYWLESKYPEVAAYIEDNRAALEDE